MRTGYKQTDVGVIPEEWEVFQFGEHFNIFAGGDVPKHSLSQIQSEEHPHPIFANAIQRNGLYGFTSEKRSEGNAVTITARGFLGHAEYRSAPFFPIVRLLVMEPISVLDAKYATYAINERVEFAIESTGVPQLTAPQVRKYSLAAPTDPEEQKAIAGALSDVDGLIAGLEALIAKKRDLKTATMQQLLTGKTRLPGFGEGVGMKQTVLGEIPEDWEVKRLKDIGSFSKGAGIKKSEATSGDINCVRYGELYTVHNDIIRNHPSTISQGVAATSKKIRAGDILFACSGETKAEIGKCAAYLNSADAYAGGDIIVLSPTGSDPSFLGYQLNAPLISAQKAQTGQGDAVVHTNAKALGEVRLPLPNPEEQKLIGQILIDADNGIFSLQHQLQKAQALKQGMMQELLTGRTRLI